MGPDSYVTFELVTEVSAPSSWQQRRPQGWKPPSWKRRHSFIIGNSKLSFIHPQPPLKSGFICRFPVGRRSVKSAVSPCTNPILSKSLIGRPSSPPSCGCRNSEWGPVLSNLPWPLTSSWPSSIYLMGILLFSSEEEIKSHGHCDHSSNMAVIHTCSHLRSRL